MSVAPDRFPEPEPPAVPVPASAVRAAKHAIVTAGRGLTVAALVSDSLDDPDAGPCQRRLVFAAGEVRIDVEVAADAGGPDLRLRVRVVPSAEPVLAVQSHRPERTTSSTVAASFAGRWEDVRVPPGPTTLRITAADREVRTACVRL